MAENFARRVAVMAAFAKFARRAIRQENIPNASTNRNFPQERNPQK